MRRTLLVAALAALLLAANTVGESLPGWYKCTCPSGGAAAKAPCVCPSTSPPGGLSPADTPQFVLFTHDDAITAETDADVRAVLDGLAAAASDGSLCQAAGTMFVTSSYTNCKLLQGLYRDGHEIADHTVNHYDLSGMSKAQVQEAVVGARAALAECGVPAADIVGWRQPFLSSSPLVRQVVQEAGGFLYDSTVLEAPSSSLSSGMAARVWPYTMQDGVPQNCAWFWPAQECSASERYPGLWEVPVWSLDALGHYSMDYGADKAHSAFDVLKANFDVAYSGNRAPFPFYTHTPYLTAHVADLKKFADYALSKPNTYFVTMRQLLAWMQNPLPASKLTAASLGCGLKGGAGAARAAAIVASASPPPPPPTPSPSPSPALLQPPSPSPPFSPAPSPFPPPASAPEPAPAPGPQSASFPGLTMVLNVQTSGGAPPAAGVDSVLSAAAAVPQPTPPASGAARVRALAGAAVAAVGACLALALAI